MNVRSDQKAEDRLQLQGGEMEAMATAMKGYTVSLALTRAGNGDAGHLAAALSASGRAACRHELAMKGSGVRKGALVLPECAPSRPMG